MLIEYSKYGIAISSKDKSNIQFFKEWNEKQKLDKNDGWSFISLLLSSSTEHKI